MTLHWRAKSPNHSPSPDWYWKVGSAPEIGEWGRHGKHVPCPFIETEPKKLIISGLPVIRALLDPFS